MPTPTLWSPAAPVPKSTNDLVNALLSGTKWFSHSLTYSFPTYGALFATDILTGYGPTSGFREPWAPGFKPLETSDQAAVRTAVAAWAHVANITLTEVPETPNSVGDLRLAYTSATYTGHGHAQAWSFFPSQSASAGDVWFSTESTSATDFWALGSYEYMTVLHELGHALGLKHSFDTPDVYSVRMAEAYESRSYTLMSYQAGVDEPDTHFSYEPTTPMILDIDAMQVIYGANTTFNSTNTTYTYGSGSYHETIWDAGGIDTIVDSSNLGSEINLNAGYGSDVGAAVFVEDEIGTPLYTVYDLWIAHGVIIENATGGGGDDVITGNEVANVLTGGGGVDHIVGGGGNDTINGGAGNDTLDGGSGIDFAIYDGLRSSYLVSKTGQDYSVGGLFVADGTDSVSGVERLRFADKSIAFDVGGAAGTSVKLIGAIFGKEYAHVPDYVGRGIAFLDSAGTLATPQQLATLAIATPIFTQLAGSQSNTDFANTIYHNLVGVYPGSADLHYLVGLLDAGLSKGALAVLAADTSSNLSNVEFAGLAASGVEYVPF